MIIKDGSIQLVHSAGQETALLTVRGKGHDLTAAELRALGDACRVAANSIYICKMKLRLFGVLPS